MEQELKQRIILALRATNSWCSEACIKMFESSDDPKKVVIPVSMLHLRRTIDNVINGVSQ